MLTLTQIFQGHLLQELDSQTKCGHFGEDLMKNGWLPRYLTFFFLFFGWPIFHLENGD